MKQLREELKKLKLYFDSPYHKAPLELDDDAIMDDNWLEYLRHCRQTNERPSVPGFWNWYET